MLSRVQTGCDRNDLKDGLPEKIEGFIFMFFESDSYALEKVLEIVEANSESFHQLKWINGGGHLMTRKIMMLFTL